ncbi:MAG: pitrilysin family protein [Gammaproteobacteria bacterium]|nr:pitrilysin family protein [Gammaproteobacteria bacterium]
MRNLRIMLLAAGGPLLFGLAATGDAATVDIPFTKYTLANGLTLVVHEDHKAPIVAVNVWYHVGSKNEKPGKTGFAHLFEHLMFNGTENYDDDYFKPFDDVGGTGINGTTNNDRTNYFQVVPKNALDLALWMESDRNEHLLGAIDQALLDEQRGVVQNEKRQGENQPYGRVFRTAFANVFPVGHPYSWSVIGSMEDLNAASLEDVHDWFRQYYGAANAVVVVAGDVDPESVRKRVEHYFGAIAPGPPLVRQEVWIPQLNGTHVQVMQDRVPQARAYIIWTMPEIGSLDSVRLDLVAGILSEGKTSRLYKRLVHDDQVASDVQAFAFPLEIAGIFGVIATALPGEDLGRIRASIEEEIERFLKRGPTQAELDRIVTARKAAFVRGAERIGGFGGKSDILAQNEVYTGDPGSYTTTLERWASASPRSLRTSAVKWMSKGKYVMEVVPFDEYTITADFSDRSKLPEPGPAPVVTFDKFERTVLSNGLKIILAERNAIPVVNLRLITGAGYSSDYLTAPGTAKLAMTILNEGTRNRTGLQLSDELKDLGATLNVSQTLDVSNVSMSALAENLDASLELFADVVLNPTFPETDFSRTRNLQIAAIQQERVSPLGISLRVFPRYLYGENHAYALPFSGSGSIKSVKGITTDSLRSFHETWFKPNNATLVIVGDTSLESITAKLEKLFASWRPGKVPEKNIAPVKLPEKATVYLIDRPGSEQSMILAGHLVPAKNNPVDPALDAANNILGGSFNSRMNMNLREDKHWSYGARTRLINTAAQRPMLVTTQVQTDKTSESLVEIRREISDIRDSKPPSAEELAQAKNRRTLTLPGRWETANAVLGSLAEMVQFDYPDDYWNNYGTNVRALKLESVRNAATSQIKPDRMIWVVVGDLEKIETGIRALNLGEVIQVDADGNPVGR